MQNTHLFYRKIKTPLGVMIAYADATHLRAFVFAGEKKGLDFGQSLTAGPTVFETSPKHKVLNQLEVQLQEYFQGRRKKFALRLRPMGTEFQMRVWKALQRVPYGQTWSYFDQAQKIGNPGAVRAVGSANGRNPLPILVPCHRIVRSDGQLGGYSAGLDIKAQLLRLESKFARTSVKS